MGEILEAGPAWWGSLLPTSVVKPRYVCDEMVGEEKAVELQM